MHAHEWLNKANSDWAALMTSKVHHRQGQFYMNHLYQHNPTVHDRISGTEDDPFYINDRLASFFVAVWTHWE